MNTNMVCAIATVALYSTGHWIGASVLLSLLTVSCLTEMLR